MKRQRKKHRKEVMAAFERFVEKFPESITQEIVAEGVYFTLARISLAVNGISIVGEGLARRSGEDIPDENNADLARNISLGRAQVACATKLAQHKPWVKLRSLLMA